MKALVCPRPGSLDVLAIADVDRPAVPDDGVLVRVHACSLNPVDFFPLSPASRVLRMLGERTLRPGPEVLGHDFAGTVESVGAGVTRFRPGDEVFGSGQGAFAEYVCLSEREAVAPKPANVSFEQAASVPVAAVTALQALRDHGRIRPGQQVIVNGASGGVGTFTVQLARVLGGEVTAVCSTRNVDLARSLGAETVVDYTREDFTRSGRRFDLLVDVAGSKSWSECRRVLAPRATVVVAGASVNTVWGGARTLRHLLGMLLASTTSRRRAVSFIAKMNASDLTYLGGLLASGAVRPVLDGRYPLEDAIEAFRSMGEGHARGKITIAVP